MPSQRARTKLIASIILINVVVDQVTKLIAQATLTSRTVHFLGDLVRLRLSQNTGAFLSLGASLSPALRFWIFTVISTALVVWVTVYALRTDDLPDDGIVAMAFVAGGGFSNLIDRVVRNGHVVDFLNFGIGNLRTGILNVADMAIFFGALYVMWVSVRTGRASPDTGGSS